MARHEALRLQRQQWGIRPLEVPTREGWDGQTGEPLTRAERIPAPVDTELALEAREALRALAGLRWRRRRALALKLAGFSYREIMELLGVTYTNVRAPGLGEASGRQPYAAAASGAARRSAPGHRTA